MKKTFYSEAAYGAGLALLAFATALMERADFGMSMVVAPAYLVHLKLVQVLPFFSFGMAEYCLQFLLLAALSLVMGRVKKGYLFSFVTAVLYGLLLDGSLAVTAWLPTDLFPVRVVLFVVGMVVCSVGVALLFHTYLAPEAYELVVKELSQKTGREIGGVKTAYDLISLGVSVLLSFAFFGLFRFEGVKWGTLITALVNGRLIGWLSARMEQRFAFTDKFDLRRVFER